MKKITLLAAILLGSTALFSQTKWSVDKAHSKIGFTVRHLTFSEVGGNFKKFNASIISSKEDFSDAVFEITIDAASINTDNDKRDDDLKSDHFFSVNKFPQITFKSTSIGKIAEKKYKLKGNLTMHGVTKPITFDLTLNEAGKQKPVAGFKATGKLSRTDFGMGKEPKAMIGDEITITANGEFGRE